VILVGVELGYLTRVCVCTAIQLALSVEMEMLTGRSSIISKRCLSALQGFGELTGFIGNSLGAHRQWASLEGVELLQDVGESGFAFADGFGRGALERLFGGDAVDPALLGELFVAGEIEANEELYRAVVFGCRFS